MNLGLLNYTIIIPIDNSYIKFNNNRINNLQTYVILQIYRILEEVVEHLFQHNLKMLNHRHIQKVRSRK
jgi:hypothetical protein